MIISELTNDELNSLISETFRQLELCEGMAMITRAPQMKARLRIATEAHRAAFDELMAEQDRRNPVGNVSLDELREELADFA